MSQPTLTHDEAIALQLCYKPQDLRAAMVAVVTCALESCSPEVWPDEMHFELPADSKNAIGNGFKTLTRAKLIERTGAWRASKAGSHKGRTIFAYRLTNGNLARAFLRRNGAIAKIGQMELLNLI